jgi:large repetitive protein
MPSRNRLAVVHMILTFVLLFTGFLGTPSPVFAAVSEVTITVTDETAGDMSSSTRCTLRKAIIAAAMTYDGTKHNGCFKGVKTIYLVDGAEYILSISRTVHNQDIIDPTVGDLDITTGLTLIGKMDNEGKGATIRGAVGFADRIIHIETTATVTLANLTITGGNAESYTTENITGGGIRNAKNSKLVLKNVKLINNGFPDMYDTKERLGGGIFNENGTVTIIDSTIEDNTAKHGGGIYNGGRMTIINSLIVNNSAHFTGGGIDSAPVAPLYTNTTTMINTTVTGNSTKDGEGAGIYVAAGSTVDLIHVTLAFNGVDELSQKVGLAMKNDSIVNMRNSLLVQNGYHCWPESNAVKITSFGYNLIDADQSCEFHSASFNDRILTYPIPPQILEGLAENGGPTKTHALVIGTEAVDAVPHNQCVSLTDQRGFNRFMEGKAQCDAGAYEDDSVPAFLSVYLPVINR